MDWLAVVVSVVIYAAISFAVIALCIAARRGDREDAKRSEHERRRKDKAA